MEENDEKKKKKRLDKEALCERLKILASCSVWSYQLWIHTKYFQIASTIFPLGNIQDVRCKEDKIVRQY